jgi:SAM-dependent methyltransferase
MRDRSHLAASFGSAAAGYDASRPTYPAGSVDWLVGDALRIADVGAGTGLLTRMLVGDGRDVIAVDPDRQMLARLGETLPHVEALVGTGEHLPLPDGALDALTFGQSWHWVDPGAASAEAARVLRPGGRLGLIWNIRDHDVPWVRAMTDLMHGSVAEQTIRDGGPRIAAPFVDVTHRIERWVQPMTPDRIVALAASRSHVITAAPDERQRILDAVRELVATNSDTAGRASIDVPYTTHAYLAVRPA